MLSYVGHGGRDICPATARAGMFALKHVFKDDRSVVSLNDVVNELATFQRTLDVEACPQCLHGFKFCIKDCFSSIPHHLIMQIWQFFYRELLEFSRLPSHIPIPTRQEARTPRNIIWLRFARFAQQKP